MLDACLDRRGGEPFVEVDWETALSLAAAALDRVRKQHGNAAIYGGSYGWGSAGRFHHPNSQVHRFLNSIGGYVRHVQNYSFAAADVILAVGSNDEGRIYFNGVDIYAFTEARPLVLDADKGKVTLKKGVNVFVFKITNEQNSWQGAMRLMTKAGAPLRDVRIRQTPSE